MKRKNAFTLIKCNTNKTKGLRDLGIAYYMQNIESVENSEGGEETQEAENSKTRINNIKRSNHYQG